MKIIKVVDVLSLLFPLALFLLAVVALVLVFALRNPRVRTVLLISAAAGLWICLLLVAFAWVVWF